MSSTGLSTSFPALASFTFGEEAPARTACFAPTLLRAEHSQSQEHNRNSGHARAWRPSMAKNDDASKLLSQRGSEGQTLGRTDLNHVTTLGAFVHLPPPRSICSSQRATVSCTLLQAEKKKARQRAQRSDRRTSCDWAGAEPASEQTQAEVETSTRESASSLMACEDAIAAVSSRLYQLQLRLTYVSVLLAHMSTRMQTDVHARAHEHAHAHAHARTLIQRTVIMPIRRTQRLPRFANRERSYLPDFCFGGNEGLS